MNVARQEHGREKKEEEKKEMDEYIRKQQGYNIKGEENGIHEEVKSDRSNKKKNL